MAVELQAKIRTTKGSGHAYRLRCAAAVPAELYGKDIENKSLEVDLKQIEKILRSKLSHNTYINLKVEGDKDYGVLIKKTQGDVLTRRTTHVDFWNVPENKEVEIDIEVRLEGKAPGLLKGGTLEVAHHKVKLICEAQSIPVELVIDISNLDVGHNIHLADIKLPKGVRHRSHYNPTIVSMVEERAIVEPAATDVAAAETAAPAAEPAKEGADKKA